MLTASNPRSTLFIPDHSNYESMSKPVASSMSSNN